MNIQNYFQQNIQKPIEHLKVFHGNGFTIKQPEDWQDKTVYTLTGPVTDGIQHNIIINIDYDVQFDTVLEFAEWQIMGMENELKGCRLLKQGKTQLANCLPAYEAVFRWYPKRVTGVLASKDPKNHWSAGGADDIEFLYRST